MNKDKVRKHLLKIRNSIKNKEYLSKLINYQVIQHIQKHFTNPYIASFISLKNEVNTSIINNHFKNIYLPVIHPFIPHALWFAKDSKKYYLNKYNIKEPIYSTKDILTAWELDIILVPIIGFNNKKYRMGMGGGFYDYTLKFKKSRKYPLTIGVAFDEQENNDIMIEKHDIKLDVIVTPTRVL
ncbi:MAG: 5-formyltetrahydrofolate cyclo-ligase [Francisella sp.]